MGERHRGSPGPSVINTLAEATVALQAIGAGNPRFEAELILAQVLAKPRVYLFTNPTEILSAQVEAGFQALLLRRLAMEPLQYVLGSTQFRDLELTVYRGVLIPRPETELLVGFAWDALSRRRDSCLSGGERGKPWLIDVGVGSGAILLSLMYEEARRIGGGSDYWFAPLGLDLSPAPLACTAGNAEMAGLPRPALARTDFLSSIHPQTPVAGIVSNPPYISASEMAALPVEIDEFEPHEALFGGADGLNAIRALLDQAAPWLARGAFFCFEIGGFQADGVAGELRRRGLWEETKILPDLAGRLRVVLIEPSGFSLLP